MDYLTDEAFLKDFRFNSLHIKDLVRELRIPTTIRGRDGCTAKGEEALYLLLMKYSYPRRASDLGLRFYYSRQWASSILSAIETHIETNFCHLLQAPLDLMTPDKLRHMAQKIVEKEACSRVETRVVLLGLSMELKPNLTDQHKVNGVTTMVTSAITCGTGLS